MELYRIEHLTFAYPGCEINDIQCGSGEKTVLHDCSFQVEEGSFVTLCGGTGSGKTTLLRLLKKELQPVGKRTGAVCYRGRELAGYDYGETAAEIGFVMQNPDDQPVMDRVWHELAFGLENMGVPSEEIRRRVAEISAYFGIDEWYEKAVEELSGGQKQILNLAAVMVMRPKVLLLDEPTAQLDPIAAQNFMDMIVRLNRELGMTILLAEHRLEDALAVSDRVMVLQDGVLLHEGTPQQIACAIDREERIYMALPCSVRLYRALSDQMENKISSDRIEDEIETDVIPLTVTQGRAWLRERCEITQKADADRNTSEAGERTSEKEKYAHGPKAFMQEPRKEKPVLTCRQVWFHYKKSHDILCGVQLEMHRGEIVSLLGSNGSGKTTLLHVIAGIFRAADGKVLVNAERIGYLPQNMETLFAADTVEEELRLVGAEPSGRLAPYRKVHPYDLSGGEKQLLAWEKVLAGKPELLLLDEPTKGLDAAARRDIGIRLRELVGEGTSILMVTHDIELAAAVSDRCGLLFRGALLALDETRAFFRGNRFYTTAAARIAQDLFPDVLTEEELTARCKSVRIRRER
ncbi:MAG: ATP-binding cassette domain-containing protein [bacterium]|nr:ATP-binding cassette domain-containing protein [bacterium]